MFFNKKTSHIKKSTITAAILFALATSSQAVKTNAEADSEFLSWTIDYGVEPDA